jgi:pyrroline-5-carboxylate reductase
MVIGFIGAGKMARALAAGLVRGGLVSTGDLICSSRSAASGKAFLELNPGASWTGDNSELVRASDLVILALKPQQFPEAVSAMSDASEGKLFLSLAAGLTLAKLSGWLHPSARVIRAMPNMPTQIGSGASVFAGGAEIEERDFALVERILSTSGRAWRVEEGQIDAVTALSGSGPAYVFHFMDALVRGAVALGLPEDLANDLARQTVLGSAQWAAQSSLSPLERAALLKSPRATTLAGCAVLEENGALNRLIAQCMAAAKARAEALARGEE